MKVLVDHQLPPVLCHFLEDHGHFARHVRDLGFKTSPDDTIWIYALANQMVIVSKDEDFFYFASQPDSRAKLVWVRIGNCRTRLLLERFQLKLSQIITSLDSGSNIVELW